MMLFMPPAMVLIGQSCHKVIGHQGLQVAVIGQLLFTVTFDLSIVVEVCRFVMYELFS